MDQHFQFAGVEHTHHACELADTCYGVQDPVVQKLDGAIHWISIRETNCTIPWIEIYPVDNAIHLLNNWGESSNH